VRIARFATRPAGPLRQGGRRGRRAGRALTVAAIAEHPFGTIELTGERWALPDVRLLAPLLPSKIVGIGKNYAEHVAEMGGGRRRRRRCCSSSRRPR
jgi:2-keto-4-pentenoate hydratase/2-oxohepta-3-ene-1,7-dioic acid hydratase in catechol pathway